MPESRAAFELVHRDYHEHTRFSNHNMYPMYMSNNINLMSTQYMQPRFFACVRAKTCSMLSGYGKEPVVNFADFQFNPSENFFFRCSDGHVYDCCSGAPLSTSGKVTSGLHNISPDGSLFFCGRDKDKALLCLRADLLKVLWTIAGDLISGFRELCPLPDNDTVVVWTQRPDSLLLQKISGSAQGIVATRTYDGTDLFIVFRNLSTKASPDGMLCSFNNVIVNVQTLKATKLPGRHGGDFICTDAEGCRYWTGPPIFFLPGSQTAIFDMQVFSCDTPRGQKQFLLR
jgi:hypothetical protein